MSHHKVFLIVIIIIAILGVAFGEMTTTKLETVTATLGDREFVLEIADTPAEVNRIGIGEPMHCNRHASLFPRVTNDNLAFAEPVGHDNPGRRHQSDGRNQTFKRRRPSDIGFFTGVGHSGSGGADIESNAHSICT